MKSLRFAIVTLSPETKGAATRCEAGASPTALRPPVCPVSCTASVPPVTGEGQRPSALEASDLCCILVA